MFHSLFSSLPCRIVLPPDHITGEYTLAVLVQGILFWQIYAIRLFMPELFPTLAYSVFPTTALAASICDSFIMTLINLAVL